ncbi:hypothetical protein MRB53_037633 [Persea americana]|nr:hypothetical protein MRB53_037633 [Persea americana]
MADGSQGNIPSRYAHPLPRPPLPYPDDDTPRSSRQVGNNSHDLLYTSPHRQYAPYPATDGHQAHPLPYDPSLRNPRPPLPPPPPPPPQPYLPAIPPRGTSYPQQPPKSPYPPYSPQLSYPPQFTTSPSFRQPNRTSLPPASQPYDPRAYATHEASAQPYSPTGTAHNARPVQYTPTSNTHYSGSRGPSETVVLPGLPPQALVYDQNIPPRHRYLPQPPQDSFTDRTPLPQYHRAGSKGHGSQDYSIRTPSPRASPSPTAYARSPSAVVRSDSGIGHGRGNSANAHISPSQHQHVHSDARSASPATSNSGRHPHSRPLPGPPADDWSEQTWSNRSSRTDTRTDAQRAEQELYSKLDRAIKEASAKQGTDSPSGEAFSRSPAGSNASSRTFDEGQTSDDYDHDSDAEAEAGLVAMRLAEEQEDAEQAARRQHADYGSDGSEQAASGFERRDSVDYEGL